MAYLMSLYKIYQWLKVGASFSEYENTTDFIDQFDADKNKKGVE